MRLADLIAMTMGDPDQDSRDLTRALFDAAFEGRTRSADSAKRSGASSRCGSCARELIGDELADKLDVPRRPIRYAMPMMKRFITAAERFTRALPFGERSAVAMGTHYWDRVVEVGLQGDLSPLPKSLANVAA